MKKWLFIFSFIIGSSICFCCRSKTVNYGDSTSNGKYYDIRGVKMYCEIYGDGTPLLMIHGNGGSIKSFKSNIPFFAKKYKVILLDSRAQGKTKDESDSLSFEMMADDEAALLDKLQIDSAYVLGWSDGGINSLLLAMRHPEKVISLASTGANIWPDSTAFNPPMWQNEKKDYDSFKNIQPATAEEKNERKLFMLDWEQPHISLQSLQSIKCPALIMCGDHDLISIEHTRLIAGNIPKGELWIVPNSGHATLKDQKDEFNKRVDSFFQKSGEK